MDVERYISTGILEDYVLGQVSDQERREVECLSKIYPEIADALKNYEVSLEGYAQHYARKVPDSVREGFLNKIKNTPRDPIWKKVGGDADSPSGPAAESIAEYPEKSSRPFMYIAAAVAILAVIVAGWQYVENQSKEERINKLTAEQTDMNRRYDTLQTRLDNLAESKNEMFDADVKRVMLKSVKEDQPMEMPLVWNTKTGEVKLNMDALPGLPADKQYQLWGLKDGKPRNMGVLPKNENGILVADAAGLDCDAFAITIEPMGGKPEPTLDQLVVMGKVAQA